MGKGRSLNEAEKEVIRKYLEGRQEKSSPLSNKEIRPLVQELAAVAGFERTVGGVRMHLVRFYGRGPSPSKQAKLPPVDQMMEKIQRHLDGIPKCIKKELGKIASEIRKEFRERLCGEREKNGMAEKKIKALQDEIRELKSRLRPLIKIEEAAEKIIEKRAA